jgi:hypothetical protein
MQVRDKWTQLIATEKAELVRTFLQGMINRMTVSHFKYGPLDAYLEDQNTEHLIDASNYLMIEWLYPSIDGIHFTPTDSDGSLGYVLRDGTIVDR